MYFPLEWKCKCTSKTLKSQQQKNEECQINKLFYQL